MADVDTQVVRSALFSMVRAMAALISSCAVIGALVWYLMREPLAKFINDTNSEHRQALDKNTAALADLLEALETFERIRFVSFNGPPLLLTVNPVPPGGVVRFLYSAQRHEECAGKVLVRFIDRATGQVDTSLSYELNASISPVSSRYSEISIAVRLPVDMPDGEYSYAPIIHPIGCRDMGSVSVPVSPWFSARRPVAPE